jgi:hypothetical protein
VSLNAAALKLMMEKGLTLGDVVEIAEANEARPSAAAVRQKRYRDSKRNERDVTRDVTVSPNDRDILTPSNPEKHEPKGSVKKFGPPDGVSAETWSDFLLSPKRRKAGMSRTAYSGIRNNLALLAEHGFPPGEMIALAVERGWTTVKLEWVLNDQRSARNDRNNSPSPLDQLVAASLGYGAGTRQGP